jgi:hypothetical protein
MSTSSALCDLKRCIRVFPAVSMLALVLQRALADLRVDTGHPIWTCCGWELDHDRGVPRDEALNFTLVYALP